MLNVKVAGTVDMSADGAPRDAHVETGNLTGSTGDDTVTLTGEQLDAIIHGDGTIDLGEATGDNDTINLKSTSTDLNTLGRMRGSRRRGDLGVGRNGRRDDRPARPDRSLQLTGSGQDDAITGGAATTRSTAGQEPMRSTAAQATTRSSTTVRTFRLPAGRAPTL